MKNIDSKDAKWSVVKALEIISADQADGVQKSRGSCVG